MTSWAMLKAVAYFWGPGTGLEVQGSQFSGPFWVAPMAFGGLWWTAVPIQGRG